jgi:hypothetical protein
MEAAERRKVRRLHFNWPVWFAEDFSAVLSHGQMNDVSRDGMAFSCQHDQTNLYPGQHITIRFSVPRFDHDDSLGVVSFVRSGHICKIDRINPRLNRVGFKFGEPLPFDPLEQSASHLDSQSPMTPAML